MTKIHTEPNTELFKKIYDQISAVPGSFDMNNWEAEVSFGETFWNPVTDTREPRACGTARCVAGWAGYFHNPNQPFWQTVDDLLGEWSDVIDEEDSNFNVTVARRLLGLDLEDARRLFVEIGDEKALEVVRLFAEGRDVEALRLLWEGDY